MTGKERMTRILKRQKTDRIGLYEHFWGDTFKAWEKHGVAETYGDLSTAFDFDILAAGGMNCVADLDFKPVILSENEDTYVQLDGNGATLRRHKHHDTTPEHIDFSVKCFDDYREKIKPLLTPCERRLDFEAYAAVRKRAGELERFFTFDSLHVFECMHAVCGHENMLAAMALEPEWIAEMAMDYARLFVSLQEILFSRCGKPDGIFYYEDLGFKQRPFMSPAMFRELIYPAHKYTIDYAKSIGLPVIMHSCGFVEPLLPAMIEAGIDMLQVIEVKAGMDLLRIFKDYGDRLSLMGGIDVRTLYTNDREIIKAELDAKIPIVKQGFGYSLHSDHSIPATVDYETYQFFIEYGLKLGKIE